MAEEAINNSLERLHISGEVKDVNDDVRHCSYPPSSLGDEEVSELQNSVLDVQQSSSSPSSSPIIICDAWYGFPSQKRPRKERINAVSRQLSNFIQWRSSSLSSSNCSAKDSSVQQQNCKVSLLGSEGDVQAVHDRMNELATSNTQSTSITCNNEVEFQPNVAIDEFINKQTKHNTNNEEDYNTDTIVYLSPDASHTLSSTCPPPRIVIIGMLIDRRITTDRSRIRAEETLKIKAVKLPLDDLNTKELTSHEPLNVDTCMELMQRWWWNCDQLVLKKEQNQKEQSNNVDNKDEEEKSRDTMYRKCFIDAAAWAMKTQRDRHPNRTVHINNKG